MTGKVPKYTLSSLLICEAKRIRPAQVASTGSPFAILPELDDDTRIHERFLEMI